MPKAIIHTNHAPAAIGAYSQTVRAGNTVYLSGQIPRPCQHDRGGRRRFFVLKPIKYLKTYKPLRVPQEAD